MTFIEALKTGRPMRRQNTVLNRSPWLYLGEMDFYPRRPVWREIETGKEVGLHRFEYEASDWEVMS